MVGLLVSLDNNVTFIVESVSENYDVQNGDDVLLINADLLSEKDIKHFIPENLAEIRVSEHGKHIKKYVGYTEVLSINSIINEFQKSTQIILSKVKEKQYMADTSFTLGFTGEEIDERLGQAHEHINKETILDLLTLTDPGGDLLFDGNPVGGGGTDSPITEIDITGLTTDVNLLVGPTYGHTIWRSKKNATLGTITNLPTNMLNGGLGAISPFSLEYIPVQENATDSANGYTGLQILTENIGNYKNVYTRWYNEKYTAPITSSFTPWIIDGTKSNANMYSVADGDIKISGSIDYCNAVLKTLPRKLHQNLSVSISDTGALEITNFQIHGKLTLRHLYTTLYPTILIQNCQIDYVDYGSTTVLPTGSEPWLFCIQDCFIRYVLINALNMTPKGTSVMGYPPIKVSNSLVTMLIQGGTYQRFISLVDFDGGSLTISNTTKLSGGEIIVSGSNPGTKIPSVIKSYTSMDGVRAIAEDVGPLVWNNSPLQYVRTVTPDNMGAYRRFIGVIYTPDAYRITIAVNRYQEHVSCCYSWDLYIGGYNANTKFSGKALPNPVLYPNFDLDLQYFQDVDGACYLQVNVPIAFPSHLLITIAPLSGIRQNAILGGVVQHKTAVEFMPETTSKNVPWISFPNA